MSFRAFKYLSPFLLYVGAIQAFLGHGWIVWVPVVYAWVLIPLLELFLRPDASNMSAAEEELARKDRVYDVLLWVVVPCQYAALGLFLWQVAHAPATWIDLAGKTLVMGLLCGTLGINVGHELGHRVSRFEQFLAKALLLTSLYLHFFIEHNRGHHMRVATREDPSSARYGEMLYAFYFRSIVFSYLSAWAIAARGLRKKGRPVFSLHNEMIVFHLVQAGLLTAIFLLFGTLPLLLFLAAAVNGIILLECVNYIEHYGLERRAIAGGRYERAMPVHSWNSDHVIGRVMLFELSRHSDHHYLASRKYQVLRHHSDAPQMPTGYPGMMILSMFPPLWFRVMNPRVQAVRQAGSELPATPAPV